MSHIYSSVRSSQNFHRIRIHACEKNKPDSTRSGIDMDPHQSLVYHKFKKYYCLQPKVCFFHLSLGNK